MSVRSHSTQRGLGLVELMVGIVVSLIVLAGTIFVFIGNSEASIFHMRSTRFVQQMRDTMDRMARDIRRAGYMGYRQIASSSALTLDNPFNSYGNSVFTTNTMLSVQCSGSETPTIGCRSITYAYNRDDDPDTTSPGGVGTVAVGRSGGSCASNSDDDNDELYGFRLRDNAVEMRVSGECATVDGGTWLPITDTAVARITSLLFVLPAGQCTAYIDLDKNGGSCLSPESGDITVTTRQVEIRLAAESTHNPDVTVTLAQVVDIPNDLVQVVP